MNLYIYKYNNYYNRIVKKENSFQEYGEPIHTLLNVKDWTPSDGVNTEHKFGSAANNYNGTGDYLLVTDANNNILSRWFIIEIKFTRQGQWNLILHRDLVVDYYDDIVNAPCFIEKATLNADNPLIFNSENITVNQVKKGEFLIENKLKTPWVVAYLSRQDGEGNFNTFSGEFTYAREPVAPTYSLESLEDYSFFSWLDRPYVLADNISFRCNYYDPTSSQIPYKYMYLGNNGSFRGNYAGAYGSDYQNWPTKQAGIPVSCANPEAVYAELFSSYESYVSIDANGIPFNSLTNVGLTSGYSLLSNEVGKTIQVGNETYEVYAEYGFEDYDIQNKFAITRGTELYNLVLNDLVIPSGLNVSSSTILKAEVVLPYEMNKITLKVRKLAVTQDLAYNFTYDKAVTTDAIYEIVATPLKDTSLIVGDDLTIASKGDMGLQWFQNLYTNNNTKVYDVQIVPYIALDYADATSYEYITLYDKGDPTAIKAIALKLKQSSFNLLLDRPFGANLDRNVKIGSETELWRVTSPNGIGNFDFNPYKNYGLTFFEIDCTLIPINPYIKINPMFKPGGLYGGDYNDFRGLICGGDFSVALTSSEWQTYQQQNKNFQEIFQREIDSMELKNKVGRAQDIVGGIAGVGAGAAAGALAGSMIPIVGTAVGAVAGGVASLAGGIGDYFANEALRNEALDYTDDMFRMNLGNIKARANTLTKTTAYNINNKYFPYIEYFTCTDEEKKAVANKIAWNGMTVMVIGKISDYIDNNWSYNEIKSENYIKGRIIRIDGIEEEFHLLKSIADEIYKGVYF